VKHSGFAVVHDLDAVAVTSRAMSRMEEKSEPDSSPLNVERRCVLNAQPDP